MANITTTTTIQTYIPPSPNPALYTDEHHAAYLAESPPLTLNPNDCIVRVRANGICGSDAHFWRHGGIGSLVVTHPYVLGHEGAGEIIHTGSAVTHLRPGDRVSIEPGVPCKHCYQCSTGSYNLCRDVQFSGAPPHNGSIRRYHVHPAEYLHKLPDSLSYTEGALLEPFSVALRGFELAPIRLGESAVITGAGPIGLCALAIAKASGARPIVIMDVDEGRLAFAKSYVPECTTFRVEGGMGPEETAGRVNEVVKQALGAQPRIVYECTGVESSVVTAAWIPQPGGTVMVIGVGKKTMDNLPFMHMSMAEVDLKFINRYNHSWPAAMRLLAHKVVDLRPLVTHRFKLEEAVEALHASIDRSKGAVKIHIEDGDDVDKAPNEQSTQARL